MAQLAFDILARDRASKVFDQVAAKSQKTERNLSKIGSTTGTVFGKMSGALAGVVGGWQAWEKVMVGGFNRLANLDDARKRLDQMGLSTSEAKKLMDGLTETVTGTAFSLDAGAGAMTGFVSAGVELDEVNSRLEMTADTAAFAQAPLDEIANIFVKIQSQGRLTAEELNMLQERGVPALVLLADAAGVTAEAMRDMISRGEVDAERFFDLWEQGSKGFGENNIVIEGAAKSMGDTLRGSLANAETALARLGAEILDDFMPTIREFADGTKESVDTAINALEGMDRLAESTGLQAFTDWLKDLNVNGPEAFNMLAESATKSNDAIESFFKNVFNVENVSGLDLIAGATEDVADKTKLFQSAAAGAKSDAGELADEMGEVAEETDAAADAFDNYQSALKAATDPVFALHDAVSKLGKAQQDSKDASRDLKRAQEDLNELRKDSDTSTRELEDAERRVADAQRAVTNSGWAVAEALAGIESAAVNGDLSFADFSAKLDQWVASGEITKRQADDMRDRVRKLTKTAENYAGEYEAELLAETNEGKLRKAQRELDAVARARNPKYLAELDRQAEIRARNRLEAMAAPRTSNINAQANTGRAEGALNSLARNRYATIYVSYAVSGGLPLGIQRQHGGPVEKGQPYIIGERGPEWFVPDKPGLVVSNKDAKSLMGKSTGSSSVMTTAGAVTARDIRRALEGMTLMIDDKRARFTARTADLYGRAG